MIVAGNTRRPRNVDAPRAAAILYGDWGTSKARDRLGLCRGRLQFVLAHRGHVCVLTAVVRVNDMAIGKHHPDGEGVYASARHWSEMTLIISCYWQNTLYFSTS
jgi:hypothetical protein